MMRILIGGIIQESNTFSPKKSTFQDFRSFIYQRGDELLRSTMENEIAGFISTIRSRDTKAEIVPTLFSMAVSSGSLTDDGFSELQEHLDISLDEALAVGEQIDGVLFAFHGAMVAEGYDDATGELIAQLRRKIGEAIPLVITLDPHANVTHRMTEQVQGIAGYRTFPHMDFVETGERAAQLLLNILEHPEAPRPAMALRKIPLIVPAENGQFHSGPLGEVWFELEEGERQGRALVSSLFPVQPWLDVEAFASAVTVVAETKEQAEQEADRLAALMWEKRSEYEVPLYTVAEIVKLARENRDRNEPIVMSDSADSPGAGSAGDSNAVLEQLLELGADQDLTCLLSMVDAPAVDAAIAAGVGMEVTLSVGHTLDSTVRTPITVTGKVRTIGSGDFYLEKGHIKNALARMGRCVVLQIGLISVLLQEQAVVTGDPAMYRSVGLEPAEADLVLVKSAYQFRAQYEEMSSQIFILDTPGSSTPRLDSLPFVRIPRPIYPFERDTAYQLPSSPLTSH